MNRVDTLRELAERKNRLEIAIDYNRARGDEDSVEEIHEEIYKINQKYRAIIKEI